MMHRTTGVLDLNNVELSSTVTVAGYREMERSQNRNGLAHFVQERLSERYIAPLQAVPPKKKHGFLVMAGSCLLVETLESFYQGWESTDKGMNRVDIKDPCKPTDPNRTTVSSGEVAFCYFFQREQEFAAIRTYEQAFYKHVRCGLLHQGETMSGWRVQRKEELFDVPNLTVNATKFLMAVRRSLRAYAEKLRSAEYGAHLPSVCFALSKSG